MSNVPHLFNFISQVLLNLSIFIYSRYLKNCLQAYSIKFYLYFIKLNYSFLKSKI